MNSFSARQQQALRLAAPAQRPVLRQRFAQQNTTRPTRAFVPPNRANARFNQPRPVRTVNFTTSQASFQNYTAPAATGGGFTQAGEANVRLSKVGTVCSITSNDGFALEAVAVNPYSVPSLKNISACYCRFKVTRLRYRFVSNVPTTETGQIATAVSYSTSTKNPKSISQMEQLEDFRRSPTWQSTPFRSCKIGNMTDRWYEVTGDDSAHSIPAYVYIAVMGTRDTGVHIGTLEFEMTVLLSGLTYYSLKSPALEEVLDSDDEEKCTQEIERLTKLIKSRKKKVTSSEEASSGSR